jgi:hypothetical protein
VTDQFRLAPAIDGDNQIGQVSQRHWPTVTIAEASDGATRQDISNRVATFITPMVPARIKLIKIQFVKPTPTIRPTKNHHPEVIKKIARETTSESRQLGAAAAKVGQIIATNIMQPKKKLSEAPAAQ